MRYAKAAGRDAEDVRRRLALEGRLDSSAEVERDGGHVMFPLKGEAGVDGCGVVELPGRMRQRRPRSLREALEGKLDGDELGLLSSSYNVVGDIAVLELDDRLMAKRRMIGEALLSCFPSIRVAAVKTSMVSGEYRVPGVEVVAGEARTETVHREHGCVYKLDVSKAYFSPRLGRERMRVASQVGGGERVLVMFAGVGPYPILIAKRARAEVVAVELNPDAVAYMRWNVMRNRVAVEVMEGDAAGVVPKLGVFDRIVMPLPKEAGSFLAAAMPALKKGGVIHYYTFARNGLEATGHLLETVGGMGRRARILEAVECGSYSPCMSRYCVDFKLE